MKGAIRELARTAYWRFVSPSVRKLFHRELISRTANFGNVTWLGHPIWQNVLDLWTIQETLAEVKPALLIECGTNRGGSSLFYAQLFDLMGIDGRIVTIDVERLHSLSHPRITYLIGSSTAPEIFKQVKTMAEAAKGPVMVILDSDHSEAHVRKELDLYTPLVTVGSYCLCQDGVIDVVSGFEAGRPGPLRALQNFMLNGGPSRGFSVDQERSDRFLVTHHPSGWLKRSNPS